MSISGPRFCFLKAQWFEKAQTSLCLLSAIYVSLLREITKHVAEVEPLDLSLSAMEFRVSVIWSLLLIVSFFSPQIKVRFSLSVFSSISWVRKNLMAVRLRSNNFLFVWFDCVCVCVVAGWGFWFRLLRR